MFLCTLTCMCVCTYMRLHVHTFERNMFTCACVRTLHAHTQMHLRPRTHERTHAHTQARTYRNTHARARAHTHTGNEWNRTVRGAENAGKPAYFPLGARFEFKHVTPPEIRRASQRELLFNFVGTISTSRSRKRMIKAIESLNTSSANAAILGRGFIQTPKRWSGNPNSWKAQRGGYLNADE